MITGPLPEESGGSGTSNSTLGTESGHRRVLQGDEEFSTDTDVSAILDDDSLADDHHISSPPHSNILDESDSDMPEQDPTQPTTTSSSSNIPHGTTADEAPPADGSR